MTVQTRAERIAAEADAKVAGWPSLSPDERAAAVDTPFQSGVVHPLKSGGFLVELAGESFPIFRADMGAVRRLLLERDLAAAQVSAKS